LILVWTSKGFSNVARSITWTCGCTKSGLIDIDDAGEYHLGNEGEGNDFTILNVIEVEEGGDDGSCLESLFEVNWFVVVVEAVLGKRRNIFLVTPLVRRFGTP
jgi:hypothetical protein